MLGKPKNCFKVLVQLTERIIRDKHLPQYLALIVKDIIRYRRGDLVTADRCKNIQKQRKSKSFIGVHYNRPGDRND